MNKWAAIGISALVTFSITAGTAYLAVASAGLPTVAQIIACVVGGLVAAARDVQHVMAPAPQ